MKFALRNVHRGLQYIPSAIIAIVFGAFYSRRKELLQTGGRSSGNVTACYRLAERMDGFQFTIGDVVLAEWTDKLFYAKILHINRSRLTCTLLFDDDSIDDCPISKIHSGWFLFFALVFINFII